MPSVNLIPQDRLVQRTRKRRTKTWGIALAVAAFLVILPVGRELAAQYQLSSQRVTLDAASKALAESRAERDGSERKLTLLRQEIARADRLRFKRKWTSMMSMFAALIPEGAWLTSFSTDPVRPKARSKIMSPLSAPQNPAETGAEASTDDYSTLVGMGGPRRLVLTGQALGIEEILVFVSAINERSVFRNAMLKSVQEGEIESVPTNLFTIECEW